MEALYDGNDDFSDVWRTMEYFPCIKVRKRMLKLDGKKGTLLRNLSVISQKKDLQCLGKTALAMMEIDGL